MLLIVVEAHLRTKLAAKRECAALFSGLSVLLLYLCEDAALFINQLLALGVGDGATQLLNHAVGAGLRCEGLMAAVSVRFLCFEMKLLPAAIAGPLGDSRLQSSWALT